MKISRVYEDNNILVVNKPYGLITHPKNATDTQPSLTDWVAVNYPELKDVGEPFIASGAPFPRHGIAHRLDKDTSGLIVIAKNQASFDYLKNLFQTHNIQKHYYALVHGKPKESSGVIDAPLGRVGLKWTTRLNGPDAKGIEDPRFGNRVSRGPNRDKKMIDSKESVTEYKVLKYYPLMANGYSLLDVSPKTGRTHQIRVHLKSIGCPIAGDPIYAPKGWSRSASSKSSTSRSRIPDSQSESGQKFTRLFLHAYKLSFITPDGKSLIVETDLPDELQKVLKMLK